MPQPRLLLIVLIVLIATSTSYRRPRVPSLILALLVGFLTLGINGRAVAQQKPLSDMTGRELYVAACQSCHAADGRGAPLAQVGFSDPLPDFTDCSYNSREAAQDWATVVAHGGPVRRFSRRMPAFGSALSKHEIERVVDYVRSLCTDSSWPRGELNLPRATETEKAFPEDEIVIAHTYVRDDGTQFNTTTVVYEKRFGARNQWELAVPIGVRYTDQRRSGPRLGDVEVALKRALFHNGDRGYIVSAGAEVIVPTGDRELGYGNGTVVYGGYLLAAQALPANFFLQMQGGAEFPALRSRADRDGYGRAVFGTTVFPFGRAFSPMAEIVAVRALNVPNAVTETDWIPQLQFSLSRRQHILGSIGMRLPITDRARRPRELVAYVLWDWFDGGLRTGW